MQLEWMQCVGDVWCKLNAVNLDHAHFDGMEGVYIIWHGGTEPWAVYVGQGVIRDRIRQHRNDPRIQAYAAQDLYVTWSNLQPNMRDSVEAYLAERWRPKVGDHHPNVAPHEVNSPW